MVEAYDRHRCLVGRGIALVAFVLWHPTVGPEKGADLAEPFDAVHVRDVRLAQAHWLGHAIDVEDDARHVDLGSDLRVDEAGRSGEGASFLHSTDGLRVELDICYFADWRAEKHLRRMPPNVEDTVLHMQNDLGNVGCAPPPPDGPSHA